MPAVGSRRGSRQKVYSALPFLFITDFVIFMEMQKYRNFISWVGILLLFGCGTQAQLYSTVESGGNKVYTFYPENGNSFVVQKDSQKSQPRQVASNSESSSSSMLDASSIASLFRDAPPQQEAVYNSEDTLAHRSSSIGASSIMMRGPEYAYSYSPQSTTTTTFGSMLAPFHQNIQSQPNPQPPSGSLSSWYMANTNGGTSENSNSLSQPDHIQSSDSSPLPLSYAQPPLLSSSVVSLMDSATHHLLAQYPTPLKAYAASLLGTHPDTITAPSEFVSPHGGGWSGPPVPASVVHLPTVYHDSPPHPGHHHNHDPFGPPPHKPFPPPLLQYVKDSVASFSLSPYGYREPLRFFSTVGKTLDSTLGGAWAARRAVRKGFGSVLSSKVRLGGTLAYVGSEAVAKAIDVAASI